jgi:hypothetical protein
MPVTVTVTLYTGTWALADLSTQPEARLVVSRSTCPPLSPSPNANSLVIGTAVINTHRKASSVLRQHSPPTLSRARNDLGTGNQGGEIEDIITHPTLSRA